MLRGDNVPVFVLSSVWTCRKLYHWDFLRHQLCRMYVLHIELYLFITLSVTVTFYQGHSSVKQF